MTTTTHSKSSRFVRLAVTTALATTALASCTGKVAPSASYSAAQAEAARMKGETSEAVQHAEAAVLASPRDAATRTLLANAYLEDGRFLSAATTYAEAIELGDTGSRTVVSHALARIALGDYAGAQATLDRFEAAIDPADFGLAMALAGRPEHGVHVLSNLIRGGTNTPKVRQNLAYAFALQGDWKAARLMVAEDVPANQVGERIASWAKMVHPRMGLVRVATLLGVTPISDPGQPAMLALSNHPSVEQLAVESAAQAMPATETVPEFAQVGELPPATRAPVFVKTSELAPVAPVAASFESAFADAGEAALSDAGLVSEFGGVRFVSNPVVQDVPAPRVEQSPRSAPRVAGRVSSRDTDAAPRVPLAKGNYNIQLGSYFSMSDAQAAWKRFQARYPELEDAEKVITKARVNGKIYYRVAAAGFARSSAQAMCSTVKGQGEGCFAYSGSRTLPGTISNNVRVAAR